MEKYLVSGGGGFIGSNIVQALVDRGDQVRVLDNFSTGRRGNLEPFGDAVEIIDGDIRDDSAVRRAVLGVNHVIHLAALPSVERSVQDPLTSNDVNINGTLNMLLASRDAGVRRFVMASSSSVYGDTPTLPKREDMTPMPLSPYALTKLAGEHYCKIFHRLYGLETFALRYFNVFGVRQDPESDYAAVIPLFVKALRNGHGPLIHGDGGQTRDFTFVTDVVAANLLCCQAPSSAAGAVYNVAWGNRTSILELAETIASVLGTPLNPEFTESRSGDVRDSQADSTLARKHLGWEPAVTLEDGLRTTVDYFLNHVP